MMDRRRRAMAADVFKSGGGDTTRPTCVITCAQSPGPTAAATLNYTITFSEVVTGFEVGDFGITGGSKSALGGSGAVYTCDVTPTGNAPVVATVAENVAQDAAGNLNTAATPVSIGITVTYTYQPDSTTGQDTHLQSAAPDTANADGGVIRASTTMSLLVKFPISVGANPTVVSGTLSLWNANALAADVTLTAYRILAANSAWIEGATWNYANPSTVRWAGDAAANGGADAGCTQSGTDHSASAMGTANYANGSAAGTKLDFALDATELDAMLSANHGLVVKSNNAGQLQIRACENATAAERPKLVFVVNYLP